MLELLQGKRKADLLIEVNLHAKIIINLDKENWTKPELEISVEFEEMNVHISNR